MGGAGTRRCRKPAKQIQSHGEADLSFAGDCKQKARPLSYRKATPDFETELLSDFKPQKPMSRK